MCVLGGAPHYYMLERFCQLEEPIRATVALSDKVLPNISGEEWEMVVLKPLENVTNLVSGKNYTTASIIPVLVQDLRNVYFTIKKATFSIVYVM